MNRIVVGIDGSPAATAALAWSAALAQGTGAALEVASVYVADPHHVVGWDEAMAWATARLDAWCEPARLAGIGFDAHVLHGEPGPALVRHARQSGAALVVVSRRSTDLLTALMAGSTAEYVAHHSSLPFAILPPSVAPHPPTHIVVGIDGTKDSSMGTRWAASTAALLGASVTAVYMPPPTVLISTAAPGYRMAAYEALEHWAAPLRECDVKYACEVVDETDGARALTTVASDVGADLIVIGTRRVAGLRPIRLGGTTMRLLHRSPAATVVVPSR